ncbi:MAG: PDZ domain-containing protein, partial [Planctomycetota bacterium]|nr:PDZ domain-containing protein [Planctomycetota bacterium]
MRFRPFHWLLAFVLAAPLSAQKDRGWLGVVLEGDRGKPAQVVEVVPEAPAAKGGVRVGDLILRLNNKSAGDIDQFIEKVRDLKAGSRITLRVRRGDAERNLRIRLGRRPEEHDERERNEREHNERE